eukprot:Awhi_evm1s3643
MMKTKPDFKQMITTLTQNNNVDMLGLQSYVILPLQRCTKYALLMRELLKFADQDTEEDKAIHARISEANDTCQQGLNKINENTREAENYQRCIEIQMSLDHSELEGNNVSVVATGRNHLYENAIAAELHLAKKKSRKLNNLYGFLFNDVLLLTKKIVGGKPVGERGVRLTNLYGFLFNDVLLLTKKIVGGKPVGERGVRAAIRRPTQTGAGINNIDLPVQYRVISYLLDVSSAQRGVVKGIVQYGFAIPNSKGDFYVIKIPDDDPDSPNHNWQGHLDSIIS